jgi:hypothetical protein
MQTFELLMARLGKIEIGEEAPKTDADAGQSSAADFAEPPHDVRQQNARHAVGQKKIEILLHQDAVSPSSETNGRIESHFNERIKSMVVGRGAGNVSGMAGIPEDSTVIGKTSFAGGTLAMGTTGGTLAAGILF